MSRKKTVNDFYKKLGKLEKIVGGKRKLGNCSGYMNWPDRGVYFFFESDETRKDGYSNNQQLRVTRVGTHAVSRGSKTKLWDRLRTHRGPKKGKYGDGGNHRASVFRKEVGKAIIEKESLRERYPRWGVGSSASNEIREKEHPMEKRVSRYIRDLPFLWLKVDDEPGRESMRSYIEKNSIALISNLEREPVDSRSDGWLGHNSPNRKIRGSGLWNSEHADEGYDTNFLEKMDEAIEGMKY